MGEEEKSTTEGESAEWPWLGTKRFWIVTAAVVWSIFIAFWMMSRRTDQPDALVPVITLSGPAEVVKGERARYSVLVRDRFGAPIPHASVRIGFWKTGLIELAHGTTSDGGDASIEVPFPDDFAEPRDLVAVAEVGVTDGMDYVQVKPRTPGQGRIFVSTDKPLYQPGQTVHVRALAMVGELPLPDKPAVIEIRTGDGIKVFRAEKKTSAFGVVSTDFVLADQVKLGEYTIAVTATVTPKEGTKSAVTVTGNRPIDVKRYSLPKLKLALEDVSSFKSDGPLSGTAHATWVFGEPVTKGAITVTLDRGAGTVFRRVVGQPDKDGAFHFELPGSKSERRGTFTLRAKLEVEGGMHAEATEEVASLGSEIKLEAFPESGPLVADVRQTVYVVATHPHKAGITIRQGKDGPAAKTSDRGIATVSVLPVRPVNAEGELLPPQATLFAFAEDGSEGKLQISTRDDALVVQPERSSYDAGEAVRVTVLGAKMGEHIAVRMTKGTEPIATGACVVETVEDGCVSTLTLPASASGLAWVHALSLPITVANETGFRPVGEVKRGKRLIIVGGGTRDLDLQVTPDKKTYAPRDLGSLDVAVTGLGGAPVKAQLGVAVADEAVFLLANVRPDLEKNFFTVDKDLATARAPSLREDPRLPPSYEPSDAYDRGTPPEVKATILAALGTMPETGGFEKATSSSISTGVSAALDAQRRKTGGWALLVLGAFALAMFAAFGLYGGSRFRRPLLLGADAKTDLGLLTNETRGLMTDWLLAVIAPPILGVMAGAATDAVMNGYSRPEHMGATWLVLAPFCAALFYRAVRRVRRAFAGSEASTFRRVLVFLPLACFIGHVAIVLVIADKGRRLESVLGFRQDAFFLPVLIAGAAQITFGLLSVVRQTMLREVTRRGRIWLFVSRASLLGLPFTLFFLGLFTLIHLSNVRTSSWLSLDEAAMEERETEQMSAPSYDNKEGGTGTRAKGEEGSMGNPNSRDTGKRFGVQGPGAGGPGDSKPIVVRDFFPETLLWAPEVITDDTGHATVKMPFADSITTWRFGLRAVSQKGQLGSTTIPLVVKQDFFVEASLPPVLTQGDEITVPVTVFSYAESAQDVTLALEGDGISVLGTGGAVLHVEPREARGFRFIVRAEKAGERVVRLKATSPTRGDAIERKISVTPNGLAVVRTVNGRLTGSTQASLELPKNAFDGGNDLYVKVYGGPLSQVSEGLDGVFHLPHGCFEQTSSTTYPSVLALDFLSRSKAVSPEVEKKAREYIGDGYQRLVSFEVPGGGFSLYGKSPASTTLTAYGLMELADMSRVSSVDEVLIERTRDWLFKKRSKTGGWADPTYYDADGKKEDIKDDVLVTAYIAWAIAASTPTPEADVRLQGVLDVVASAPSPSGDGPYALALRANALLAGGRGKEAHALLDRLAPQAVRQEDGVHFTSRAVGVMYSYGASLDVEVTALATHAFALLSMQPELRAGALDWLVARRNAYGTWSTTQATVAAMRALLDEAKPAPNDPQDITVLVDGEPVETFRMEPKGRDVHHLVGLRRFATTGKHVVELRATGAGDVSYQLVAGHYVPWQRQAGAGLTLDVAYAPNAVPVGTTASCHVRLGWTGKGAARMPLVEIGIPPAFEVESDDLEALLADGSKSGIQRYSVERGRVTLYLARLSEDKPLAIDLRLRALRPARVVAPASAAYLYYEPEVRTESAPQLVRAF